MIGQSIMLLGGVVSVATISFEHSDIDIVDRATYTFTAVPLGAAASNRKIVVGIISGGGGADFTVDAVTVGGSSAALVVSQAAASQGRATIYQIELPTGTTGDVVVTLSGTQTRCAIGVWAIYGAATAVNDTGVSTANPLNDTLAIPAGGVALGAAFLSSGAAPIFEWTNLTEKFDAAAGEGTSHYSGASDAFATIQTALSITASGTTGGTVQAMALASWGPA